MYSTPTPSSLACAIVIEAIMRSQRTVVAMSAVKLALDVAKQDADINDILAELDNKGKLEVSVSYRGMVLEWCPGAQVGYGWSSCSCKEGTRGWSDASTHSVHTSGSQYG